MKRPISTFFSLVMLYTACTVFSVAADEGFVPLFNGKNLDGWEAAENPDAFSVEPGGVLAVNGRRGHLFYAGDLCDAKFRNFHLILEVKTAPGSNSGVFFHTKFQEKGWPRHGYEAQVDNSHKDPKRTGSIYNVVKVNPSPAKDDVWFTYEIIVRGKQIITRVDGRNIVNYTEPDHPEGPPSRRLSSGTIALQGHDPKSKVWYRNIRMKPLPDDAQPIQE